MDSINDSAVARKRDGGGVSVGVGWVWDGRGKGEEMMSVGENWTRAVMSRKGEIES